YGRLHPDPQPPDWYRDPEVLAQVTPYQVHFKAGHFNSQAWVTRFADGMPVQGARVSLHRGARNSITSLVGLEIEATTDADGLALLPGLEQIDPGLEYINSYRPNDQGFFARVEYDGDIALLPLNYYYEIDGVGTYSWLRPKGGHTHAWGTTAQGIYKLGDRIQFKIYVRDQSNRHWVSPGKSAYRLQVIDPQDKVVYEQKEISLSAFGAFDGEFKVAEQGAVGWYRFKLTPEEAANNKRDRLEWHPMSVLVTDFTPSPFKVKTELNGDLFRAADRVVVTSLATLHSGGPFTDAEIRLTARLKTKDFTTSNPLASGFSFGGSKGQRLSQAQRNLLDVRGMLSDSGEYENAFTLKDADIYFGRLMVESAVKDDRGKFVASSSSADYAGRDRFVGLKNTRWLYQKGEPARLETLVVDQQGELVAGGDIRIDIFHREYKASRVKGPGNAYLTKNIMQWVEQSSCELKSQTSAVSCEFEPQRPGYYQFVATTRDSKNREHKTTLNGWATGSGSVIWDQTDDATLQIIPEQTEYQIGDTARYLIKNPFPGARALVTVERYGVLDSWIEVLETGTPVIEVPIKPDYLPGFYLSVVAMSPRVAKPLSAENVDLGKPSFRMGYVSAEVSDPYKQIDIDVVTDKAVYKPRERVKADIQLGLKHAQGDENYEIAIAVVDESVLALNRRGDRYYDPYAGFNRLDSLDVNNYSLISRLVGRQKFEKKGANPGGGGSDSSKLRNLFKFVSYWNPSISPDADGKARIEFEVPDNLTGWRVLALAVTEDDEMGLGDANFKVNRPTEIRPVMPNQVVEGDSFSAGFSVMNRTGEPRKLKVDVRLQGPLAPGQATDFSYQLEIAAFKRENVWIPVNTRGDGELSFAIDGRDAIDGDALEHRLPVNKRRSLETAATYGSTTEELSQVSVRVPDGIHTDVGYIGAVLSPTVIGNVDGAMRYVRDYPYLCWEQRLTRAITANSYIELKDYLQEDTEWPSPEQDIVKELEAAANFQAPNGGMTYWVASNQYVSPYLSAYTAIGFNWLRSSGYRIPTAVEDRLHDYLLNLLRRDEFPSFYSKGMASSVRAVALAALAESGRIDRNDIDRYRSHLPEMDLFGQSHFLLAAAKIEGVDNETLKSTLDSILGHASQSGGKFQFNEAWDDSYKYLLATPLRSNCSILSSLLTLQAESDLNKLVGDIPFKMVRSITQSRGNREHWENTQENVFCMNALIDYARVYEATEPAMEVKLRFDGEDLGKTRFNNKTDPMVSVKRDLRESDEGLAAKLEIERKGQGRLYYSARIAYDLKQDNASRINSGIELRREYSVERDGKFVLLESPFKVKRGEVVKVDLFVSVPTARHFVVVNDPIPGGLEPVNTDLATASQVDAEKGDFKAAEESYFYQFSNWTYFGRYFWSFYHKELRHDSARFYADYLPAGNYHLSYAAQVIAEGDFTVMPTHAEEMYDPDIYGKGLPATLKAAGR
ncbi:MAG: MG2 domain-containing protein, partial [Gammaproteobacteria bacterium]|nr:MG2 domain-containing protein [Gammaproteobacteria bacterium]